MNADRPHGTSDSRDAMPPPAPARESAGEPVVTSSPSSHQPANVPPAGSEPQGRTTTIAAIVAIVVVVALVIFIFI